MLTYPCPRCGRAKSVAANARCESCGDTSAPPPEVVRALQEGRAAGTNLDLLARQLEELERFVVRLEDGNRFAARVWGVLAFPLAIVTLAIVVYHGVHVRNRFDQLMLALIAVFPLHVVFGLVLRHARTKLVRDAREELNRRPDMATRSACRSCGAPLDVTLAQRNVRCAHCGTDNVLDAGEARAGARAELGAFDQRAPQILAKLTAGAGARAAAMLACLAAAPAFCAVVILLAVRADNALSAERHPLDPTHQYAMRRVQDPLVDPKDCVERGPAKDGARPLHPESLVGRTMVINGAETCSGKVITAVFTDGYGEDWMACGEPYSFIERMCFPPGPP